MGSLMGIVAALQRMGEEMKALGDEAEKTTAKAREARNETASKTNAAGGSTTSMSSSSLGDPRNAEDQAARMIAAIAAAGRGR